MRELGDLRVSAAGLGGNNFSRPRTASATQEGSTSVVLAAIDSGINFIDTAEIYGAEAGLSETFLGAAIAGRRRDEVVIATKFGHHARSGPGLEGHGPRGGARYIRAALEGSLRRLGTDYVDLFQMHSPDPATPIEETLAVLDELVLEGKVRAIGSSNFSAAQLRDADARARAMGVTHFVSAQHEYSLLARGIERDVLPAASDLGLAVLPYFPLRDGLLTGKYTRAGGEGRLSRIKPHLLEAVDWDQLESYQSLCDSAGVSMLAASIGWLLARGMASVIAGATTPEQARANAAAAEVELPAELVDAVDQLFAPAQP